MKYNLDKTLRQVGEFLVNEAKQNITDNGNIDTGNLRNSITYEVEDDESGATLVVGTNVFYAPYIEFGTGLFAAHGDGRQTPWSYQTPDGKWHTTSGYKPHPFLQPALDNNKEKITEFITNAVMEELKNG